MAIGVFVQERAVEQPTVVTSEHIVGIIGTDTDAGARGFAATPPPVVTTDGSGTGAVINSFTVNPAGLITAVTWASGGSGYATSDVLTFTQGRVRGTYTLVNTDHSSGTLNALTGKTIAGAHFPIPIGTPVLVRPGDAVEDLVGTAGTLHQAVEHIWRFARTPVLCSRFDGTLTGAGLTTAQDNALEALEGEVAGFPGLRLDSLALAEDTYAKAAGGASASTQPGNSIVTKAQEVAARQRIIAFVDAPPDSVANALAWAASNLTAGNNRIIGCADRLTVGTAVLGMALAGAGQTARYDREGGEHISIRNKSLPGVSADTQNLRYGTAATDDLVRLTTAGLAVGLRQPGIGWLWWGGELSATAPFDRSERRRVADLIYREQQRVGFSYLEGIASGGDLAGLLATLRTEVIGQQVTRGVIAGAEVRVDEVYNAQPGNVAAGRVRFTTNIDLHSYIEQIHITNEFDVAAPAA